MREQQKQTEFRQRTLFEFSLFEEREVDGRM
jgi:hypothetical protein